MFDGVVDPLSETWMVRKDASLGWQLQGNQHIVELEQLSFHCNDYDATDSSPGGACGINVQFFDNDATNNGTGGAFIASGKVEVLDASNAVKATIYLGTPPTAADGEIQVFEEGTSGSYTGDWKAFGTGTGQIDPAVFNAGDTIRYSLYTQNLDITDPSAPAIPEGAVAVAEYSNTLTYAPSTTPLYPTASPATLTAMTSFMPGSNLDIGWTVQSGTRIDEVLVQVTDSSGNDVEIWDNSMASSATTISVASTEFSSLDASAGSYELLVRIYAIDELTGQEHSSDYRTTITTGGTGGGTGSTFTCAYESGWDDTLYNGNGGPINPNSFNDYEAVIADCGTAQVFAVADIAGSVFTDQGETFSFNDSTGAGTVADPKTGSYDDGAGFTVTYNWWVETDSTGNYSYVVVYADSTTDASLPSGIWFRETSALTGVSGTPGVSGAVYTFVKYSEGSDYSDTDRAAGSDGEIWTGFGTLQ